MLASCYRNANGVIVVFDVTNKNSFANLTQWLTEVTEFTPKSPDEKPPRLLIGNKCDLESRREVEREKAEKFAQEHGMKYIETSAVSTVNIKEAFVALLKSKLTSS